MAIAAAAMGASSRWVAAHRRNLLLLPDGPVGPLAPSEPNPNRHLHQDVEVVQEALLRGNAPSGSKAGCGWACPREVHYGLAPPRHARAGRPSDPKPEVKCDRPVLHVAPPSGSLTPLSER